MGSVIAADIELDTTMDELREQLELAHISS